MGTTLGDALAVGKRIAELEAKAALVEELLAALKLALPFVTQICHEHGWQYLPMGAPESSPHSGDAQETIQAAIAKAERAK
jgi:hypothetical protein